MLKSKALHAAQIEQLQRQLSPSAQSIDLKNERLVGRLDTRQTWNYKLYFWLGHKLRNN
jgi:hypothetical protein